MNQLTPPARSAPPENVEICPLFDIASFCKVDRAGHTMKRGRGAGGVSARLAPRSSAPASRVRRSIAGMNVKYT